MPKERYMGRGYKGTRGRPSLRRDLEKLTDAAKRRRRKKLERTTQDNLKRVFKEGKKPRTIARSEVERELRAGRSIERRIRHYQDKVAEMRQRAAAVKRSGTGNVKAQKTYLRTAKEYQEKIRELRAEKKREKK